MFLAISLETIRKEMPGKQLKVEREMAILVTCDRKKLKDTKTSFNSSITKFQPLKFSFPSSTEASFAALMNERPRI